MNRYKLIIEYSGPNFSGMQRQNDCVTVQGVVEDAVSNFFNEDIKINFAGRTDAGVHAVGQVVDFASSRDRPVGKVALGVNFFLKGKNVVCLSAERVNADFHSRFSAKERHYVYKIINRNEPLTFLRDTHLLVRRKIDIDLLKEVGKHFVGRRDFSLFCNAQGCQGSCVRTINSVRVERFDWHGAGQEIHIFFSAKSFLYNMVRKMVAVMLDVATGKLEIEEVSKMLDNRSSHVAGMVRAEGLYLLRVDY